MKVQGQHIEFSSEGAVLTFQSEGQGVPFGTSGNIKNAIAISAPHKYVTPNKMTEANSEKSTRDIVGIIEKNNDNKKFEQFKNTVKDICKKTKLKHSSGKHLDIGKAKFSPFLFKDGKSNSFFVIQAIFPKAYDYKDNKDTYTHNLTKTYKNIFLEAAFLGVDYLQLPLGGSEEYNKLDNKLDNKLFFDVAAMAEYQVQAITEGLKKARKELEGDKDNLGNIKKLKCFVVCPQNYVAAIVEQVEKLNSISIVNTNNANNEKDVIKDNSIVDKNSEKQGNLKKIEFPMQNYSLPETNNTNNNKVIGVHTEKVVANEEDKKNQKAFEELKKKIKNAYSLASITKIEGYKEKEFQGIYVEGSQGGFSGYGLEKTFSQGEVEELLKDTGYTFEMVKKGMQNQHKSNTRTFN